MTCSGISISPGVYRAMPPVHKTKRKRMRHFLREWREHRKLTQERAAERIGISRENLSRIERGLVPYNQDMLESSAIAYMCEPADLVMRNPLMPDPVQSLQDALKAAEPQKRTQIQQVIEALLKAS